MIEEDMEAIKKHFPKWKADRASDVKTIALLSPNKEQADFIRELFPDAKVTELTVFGWDLNDKNENKYDLIYAASVLMASPQPDLWMQNILDSCKLFWLQDHIRRWRGGTTECDPPTGDQTRFTYKEHRARIDNAYDLEKTNVVAFEAYKAGPGAGPEKDAVSFIACLVGNVNSTDSSESFKKAPVKQKKPVL